MRLGVLLVSPSQGHLQEVVGVAIPRAMTCPVCGKKAVVMVPDGRGHEYGYCAAHKPGGKDEA